MNRKAISILLILLLTLISASSTATIQAAEFTIQDGVLIKYDGAGGDVVLPDEVTSIGERAFYGNASITGVVIPKQVTSIGKEAFASCSMLASVQLAEGLATIGASAFESCNRLTEITIPSSVRSIEKGTFNFCKSLKSITLREGLVSIDDEAFVSAAATSVTIPQSVTALGKRTFGYDGWTADAALEKKDGFVVRGYTGSIAEQYASDNGFTFESVGVSAEAKGAARGTADTSGLSKLNNETTDKASAQASDPAGGATGSNHVRDDTPGTADLRLPKQYLFCMALFLLGLSLWINGSTEKPGAERRSGNTSARA